MSGMGEGLLETTDHSPAMYILHFCDLGFLAPGLFCIWTLDLFVDFWTQTSDWAWIVVFMGLVLGASEGFGNQH